MRRRDFFARIAVAVVAAAARPAAAVKRVFALGTADRPVHVDKDNIIATIEMAARVLDEAAVPGEHRYGYTSEAAAKGFMDNGFYPNDQGVFELDAIFREVIEQPDQEKETTQ